MVQNPPPADLPHGTVTLQRTRHARHLGGWANSLTLEGLPHGIGTLLYPEGGEAISPRFEHLVHRIHRCHGNTGKVDASILPPMGVACVVFTGVRKGLPETGRYCAGIPVGPEADYVTLYDCTGIIEADCGVSTPLVLPPDTLGGLPHVHIAAGFPVPLCECGPVDTVPADTLILSVFHPI